MNNMKAFTILIIVFFNCSLLFSQVEYDLKFDTINLLLKYRGNDTIFAVKYCKVSKVSVVKNKYIRKSRKYYECKLPNGNVENGKFRTFLLCNNPFRKEKRMEKTGIWNEYDSNNILIKTIDYDNLDIKSIRLFPIGRYTYANKKRK